MREGLDRPAEVDWEQEKQRVLREIEHEKSTIRFIDPDTVKEARLKDLFEQLKTIEEARSRKGAALSVEATETEAQLAGQLSRRFRIVRRLGEGGMGAVFLAEQIAVGNRPVALKVLSRKLLDDPDFLLRFQNEAASTGRIHHPNVVTIYESGQADDGTPYIAMEFLEGESLRQALSRRGQLPVPEVAEILQQAARGLNAAHKLGIIHRDLKPDNIFLTRGDEGETIVKVVDFGIAKLRESTTHTQTGMVLGTPAYMSFEQASGMRSDELDARSDIYSLGVVVYEMLTGRAPFQSDTPVGYLRMHMQEDPPPFRAVKPDLPALPQLESVVMKALTKDRNQRYGSVLEFAQEFAKAAAIDSQPAPPERGSLTKRSTLVPAQASATERQSRVQPGRVNVKEKSRWSRWALWVVAAVALAVGGTGAWWSVNMYRAQTHAEAGKALYDKHDFDGAIREYTEAVRLKPSNPEFHNALGHARESGCSDFEFDTVLNEIREFPQTTQPGEESECERRITQEYRQAVQLRPEKPEFHFDLARALDTDAEGHREAINEYRQAIHQRPDYAEAHRALGVDLCHDTTVKDHDQLALQEFREALELKPEYAEAHFQLANCLSASKDYGEAIPELREAVRLKPDEFRYHTFLGRCLFDRGDTEGAILEFREASRLDPRNEYAHSSLGKAMEKKGELRSALQEYKAALDSCKVYPVANCRDDKADFDRVSRKLAK